MAGKRKPGRPKAVKSKPERFVATPEVLDAVREYASVLTEKIDIAIILEIPPGKIESFIASSAVDAVYQPALRKALAGLRKTMLEEANTGNVPSAKLLLEHADKAGLL